MRSVLCHPHQGHGSVERLPQGEKHPPYTRIPVNSESLDKVKARMPIRTDDSVRGRWVGVPRPLTG